MTNDKIKEIATTIRIMAFSCKSTDVFSSKFGNEFGDRVESYLKDVLTDVEFNLKDLIQKFEELMIAHPNLRRGQVYYNALHDINPSYANEITGTEFDPFYDDTNIDKFMEFLSSKLVKE